MFSGRSARHGFLAAGAAAGGTGASAAARAATDRARGMAANLGHAVLDRAEALDLDAHDVAGGQERRRVEADAHARRRAGEDQVAGLERAGLAQEAHDVL